MLVRLDVAGQGYYIVNVEPPAGWCVRENASTAECIERAIDYLTAVRDKLRKIGALE